MYDLAFLNDAHKRSINHNAEILSGKLCGCFYCISTFSPIEIEGWIDEVDNEGTTALCPRCGIDSVLSDKFPIADNEFLVAMNKRWF